MLQIPLQPLYSLPCKEHKQMTLIARDVSCYPLGPIGKYQFNPTTLEFHPVTCSCCSIIYGVDDFEYHGTKGIRWTKYQHDINWNPLICIGVTWNEKLPGHGVMDLFVRIDGQVGRYLYDHFKRSFIKKAALDCQMHTVKKASDIVSESYLLDPRIVPIGAATCETHGKVLRSKNLSTESGPEDRFQWNPYREQFEWIDCGLSSHSHCNLTHFKNQGIMMESRRGNNWYEIGKKDGRVRKCMSYKYHGRSAPSAVVRDLRGFSVQELKAIREKDIEYAQESDRGTYGMSWYIFPSTGETDKTLMTNDKGEIRPVPEKQREEASLGIRAKLSAALIRKQVVTDSQLSEEFVKFQRQFLKECKKDVMEEAIPPQKVQKRVRVPTPTPDSDVDSDVDYDEDPEAMKVQKPMAPESVITRDADSYSMLSMESNATWRRPGGSEM